MEGVPSGMHMGETLDGSDPPSALSSLSTPGMDSPGLLVPSVTDSSCAKCFSISRTVQQAAGMLVELWSSSDVGEGHKIPPPSNGSHDDGPGSEPASFKSAPRPVPRLGTLGGVLSLSAEGHQSYAAATTAPACCCPMLAVELPPLDLNRLGTSMTSPVTAAAGQGGREGYAAELTVEHAIIVHGKLRREHNIEVGVWA